MSRGFSAFTCTVKQLGYLSFGHWRDVRGSRIRSAKDSLLNEIDLAVAAEEHGIDGAFFRVHHFAQQHAAPMPLLAAIAARTTRIRMGTGVIDMRYENPLYLAEEAAAVDLISGGRLELGISRGSPETVVNGYEEFGYHPDTTDADMARANTARFLSAIRGEGIARPNPQQFMGTGLVPIEPRSPGLHERVWWGAGSRKTAVWAARQGMQLQSSTLLTEDTGVPFDELQREQIDLFREEWRAWGWAHEPRVSVSRSIVPITDDESMRYFGLEAHRGKHDQVGRVDHETTARFGRQYVDSPEALLRELARDVAIQAADTLLVTVPTQLGVDFNVRMLAAVRAIGLELGWFADDAQEDAAEWDKVTQDSPRLPTP